MKQNANESYQDFKLRRQVDNEAIDTQLKGRIVWNSGTFRRAPKPEMPKRKREIVKTTTRHRVCGQDKRRARASLANIIF